MDQQALDRIVSLVMKRVCGTLTPEEKDELDIFLQQPGTDLDLWHRLLDETNRQETDSTGPDDPYDIEKAKKEFYKQIENLQAKDTDSSK